MPCFFTMIRACGALLATAAAGPAVTFRNVDVFDGIAMQRGRSVVVRDGTIESVEPGATELPSGTEGTEVAEVIGGAGRTLLPGLIDAHTHDWGRDMLQQAVMFGVTAQLDMFCSPLFAAAMRAEQAAGGAGDRADLFSAGILATAPGGHGTQFGIPVPPLTKPEDAAAFVDARLAEGSDYIKIAYEDGSAIGREIPCLSKETLEALINATHARGKLAVVHVMALERAREAVAAGADGLVHVWIDRPFDDGIIAALAQRPCFVVPTLNVNQSVAGGPSGGPLADDPTIAPFLVPSAKASLMRRFPVRAEMKDRYRNAAEAVRAMKAAGVPVLAGTDAPNPGTTHGASIHRELELLVEAGLTPTEALVAATSAPAQRFGLAGRGRIAPGARADLVLVEGDPTEDIRATRRIVGVWKDGRRIDRDTYRTWVQAITEAEARPADAPSDGP